MKDIKEELDEAKDGISPLKVSESRRQHQQLRFLENNDEPPKEKRKLPSFKTVARATRLLSVYDPSTQLPSAQLRRLRQLHRQISRDGRPSISEEITDELLEKLPFKIEVIAERRDNFTVEEGPLSKKRNHTNKEALDIPKVIPSGLTDQRRLEIIEEILKDLSQKDIVDEVRRANAISFELPKNNQMQKNVAERIRDLTGNDIVRLNDHLYMKQLCQILDERYKQELENIYKRLESNEKHRQRLEKIRDLNK